MMLSRPSDHLVELFQKSGIDRRLFALRDANPELSYELDEIARAVARLREQIVALVEPALR